MCCFSLRVFVILRYSFNLSINLRSWPRIRLESVLWFRCRWEPLVRQLLFYFIHHYLCTRSGTTLGSTCDPKRPQDAPIPSWPRLLNTLLMDLGWFRPGESTAPSLPESPVRAERTSADFYQIYSNILLPVTFRSFLNLIADIRRC